MLASPEIKNDKRKIVLMFNSIAPRYDLLNFLLSFGMVGFWRNRLIKNVRHYINGKDKNIRMLDIATGTGKIAFKLSKMNPLQVVGIDISDKMLNIARERAKRKKLHNFVFKNNDAEELTFSDNYFDVVTVCFGIRNFRNTEKVYAEVFRVMKPGGAFFIIEFSKNYPALFHPFIKLYMHVILPLVGSIISRNRYAYVYLTNSINAFDQPDKVVDIIKKSGFNKIIKKTVYFGIITFYKCVKPEK